MQLKFYKKFLLVTLSSASLILTACDAFKEKEKLKGERESLLVQDEKVLPDPTLYTLPVILPKTESYHTWQQAGGTASHVVPPLAINPKPNMLWDSSIGTGNTEDNKLVSSPVTDEKFLYVADSAGTISALDKRDGSTKWTFSTKPEDENSESHGSGIAVEEGKVIVTSSYGEVIALDNSSGKVLWRKKLDAPFRTSPTIHNGKIYAVSLTNKTHALSLKDGAELWTHVGTPELTALLGGASPAVVNDMVVTTYSSGEVFALHPETGAPLWSDMLMSALRVDSVSSIPHVRARPIITETHVYVISHGGRFVCLDKTNGMRVWQLEISGIRSPALIGDYLFLITQDNQVVCVQKMTGKIRWSVQLPKLYNVLNPGFGLSPVSDPMTWAGPVAVNDELLFSGSNGDLLFLSAKDGSKKSLIATKDSMIQSPIVANKTIYVLSENGRVKAYK